MKLNSVIDYCSCILVRALGFIFSLLPVSAVLFIGRRIGILMYWLDTRHRAIAYANIRFALAGGYPSCRIKKITKEFYRGFGQSIFEIFIIPRVNRRFVERYITIEGYEYVERAFKSGRGVIFAGIHEGSWELYNVICKSVMSSGFSLFVRQQDKFPRLNRLLNSFRRNQGCQIIEKGDQTRQLVELLEAAKPVGMTVDQGGKGGVLVEFFGRDASFSSGAIRLAIKYDALIVPAFYARLKGLKGKIIVKPPLEMKKTGDLQKDIRDNLQNLALVFEGLIREYPREHLWTYKIWKYSKRRKIAVLSDSKAGHLRQAQALSGIVSSYFKENGIETVNEVIMVDFKNRFSRSAIALIGCLAGKYSCQGCLRCLKVLLRPDSYQRISAARPDIVISCGSSLAAVNSLFSRENLSKSFILMKPPLLSLNRFDLAVISRHDHPPIRKNVVVTEGALNSIDQEYLSVQAERLSREQGIGRGESSFYIGILIGGESRNFHLDEGSVACVVSQVKLVAEKYNAGILLTTSRRTSGRVEELLKIELKDYPRCKLLVIANEKNIPGAVEGILGLSRIAIVSGESISMISEAAASSNYVLVFGSVLEKKHRIFLKHMAEDGYIFISAPGEIASMVSRLVTANPRVFILADKEKVRKKLEEVL